MPGLAGIITKSDFEMEKGRLQQMVDCMVHESFYNSGSYINEQMGVYCGWVCQKGSFSDCMPVFNEKKDVVLLFSGENFVDRDVVERLKESGHEFEDCNATYLVHLYEQDEDAFLGVLNGWFAGILIDLRKEKTFIFNDRFGMGRIYYHEAGEGFFFGSEAKAILEVKPELREINKKSLGEFFMYGCSLQNRSFFKEISILPGGSAWVFEKGYGIKRTQYFRPSEWEGQGIMDKEIFYGGLKERFRGIIPRYFNSKQTIGLSLTGGLDTRMILAFFDKLGGNLPCYTFGGMYRDCYDVLVGRKVAAFCHQPYHVLRLGSEFLTNFSKYAEKTIYVTDGCLDICGSHEVYLNSLAREIAPIRMTGNYGSEVLRSVSQFKPTNGNNNILHPDFKKYIESGGMALNEIKNGDKVSFAVFLEIPWLLYGRLLAAQSQLTIRTPYMDNEIVELMYRAPDNVRNSKEVSLRLIGDGNPALGRIMTDRGVGGSSNFLISKITRAYLQLLFKAEYHYILDPPHWLMQFDYMSKLFHLERFFLGRHKIENYRLWFRNELAEYVREVLLDKRTGERFYINTGCLEEIVNGHLKGRYNYGNEINKIMTAELTFRLLIDN